MSRSSYEYGQQMEAAAMTWYLAKYSGSRLIARNYRCKTGEIDLIFEDPIFGLENDFQCWQLVFVEVKARSAGSRFAGINSISLTKRLRLRRAVNRYLLHYRGPARTSRFDFLILEKDQAWNHLKNCWLEEAC